MNSDDIFDVLQSRVERTHLEKRLRMQVDHSMWFYGAGKGLFHWENVVRIGTIVEWTLKPIGLFGRGHRNSIDFRVETHTVSFPDLPPSLDGYGILQISDPHWEGIAHGKEKLIRLIGETPFDLCVITGDFRFETFGDYARMLREVEDYTEAIGKGNGVYAILGNHDFIEVVPALERMGIRMLLNESVEIRTGDSSFWLAGLDDAHFYGTDDLSVALQNIPAGAFKVLLVHSPELIREAAQAGVSLYLSGHTHGGQICLPGGIPVLTNASCGRKYSRGPWEYGKMRGYTSRGTGSSSVAVRFFCPPEITIHRLRRS